MSIFQSVVIRARQELARVADVCVLPNEERVRKFKAQTGIQRPVECVWNTPRLEEARGVKLEPNATNPLTLFYGGSLSADRLPLNVLDEIVKRHPSIVLHIVGYETYSHQNLIQQIQNYHKKGLIKYYGALSRHKIWKIADECEAALCLMPANGDDINLKHMAGASNKPFDALASGLGVVIADQPEWTRLYLGEGDRTKTHGGKKEFRLSEKGYGIAINPQNSDSVGAGLDWMLENRKKLWEMGERGRKKIQEDWNYEKAFAPVLKKLEGWK